MATLDNLEIVVSANTDRATQGINNLTSSLRKLRNVFKETAGTNGEVNQSVKNFKIFGRELEKIAQIDFSKVETSLQNLGDIARANVKEISKVLGGGVGEIDLGERATPTAGKLVGSPIMPDLSQIRAVETGFASLTKNAFNIKTSFNEIDFEAISQQVKSWSEATKDVGKNIDKASSDIEKFFKKLKGRAIFKILQVIINLVVRAIKSITQALGKLEGAGTAEALDRIVSSFSYLTDAIGTTIAPFLKVLAPVLETIMDFLAEIFNYLGEIVSTAFGLEQIVQAEKEAKKYNEELKKTTTFGIDELNILGDEDETSGLFTKLNEGNVFFQQFEDIFAEIKSLLADIMPLVKTLLDLFFTVNELSKPILDLLSSVVKLVNPLIKAITKLLQPLLTFIQKVFDIITAIAEVLINLGGGILETIANVIASIFYFLTGQTEKIGQVWARMGEKWKQFLISFINFLIRIANFFISIAEEVVNFFAGFINWIGKLAGKDLGLGVNWQIKELTPNAFATGGFPEDGLFYANHNELVGGFTNGKTAVANNEQIIEGIKQGVKEAMLESGGQNVNVYLDSREIAKRVEERQRARGADIFKGGYAYGK